MALTTGTKRLLREAASWGVVAVIAVAAVMHLDTLTSGAGRLLGEQTSTGTLARQDDAAPQSAMARSGSVVEIPAGSNGHFHTQAEIDGRSIEVLVDTGATTVALSYEDAEAAGIYLNRNDFTSAVNTANGVSRVAPVTLGRVSIGDITVRNVPAVVSEPGRLKTSLLGMSFLSRLSRFDMRSGTLVLED